MKIAIRTAQFKAQMTDDAGKVLVEVQYDNYAADLDLNGIVEAAGQLVQTALAVKAKIETAVALDAVRGAVEAQDA